MKILMVNKFLFPNGGSETYIFKLGQAFMKKGHKVEYFGMEHPDRIVGNHAESYTSSMDFHTGKMQKILYPFKIIYSGEARRKLRKVLDDFEPDVVHLNNFNFQITPSVIYEIRKWGKVHGKYIPIVYTAHDYQWVCPNHMLFIPGKEEKCFQCEGGRFRNCIKNKCIHNSFMKSFLGTLEADLYRCLKTYDKVDLIICPSKFMKDKLSTNPVLKKKLLVMYNFLDRKDSMQSEKKDYVLYFGRYAREKGIHTLLKACEKLPDIHFIFAGNGDLKREIVKYSNIKDAGFVMGKDLAKLISEAKFSIFPSEWYENCPFSVMESQLHGTPVIASRIGGVPELLEEGVTGDMFEPGRAEELKAKIEDLWYNNDKLKRYTENCRNKKFDTAEEYAEQIERIYKNIRKGTG